MNLLCVRIVSQWHISISGGQHVSSHHFFSHCAQGIPSHYYHPPSMMTFRSFHPPERTALGRGVGRTSRSASRPPSWTAASWAKWWPRAGTWWLGGEGSEEEWIGRMAEFVCLFLFNVRICVCVSLLL